MATAPQSKTGGPGSSAITNDDAWTYTEPDNGYDDFTEKTIAKTKDKRSY